MPVFVLDEMKLDEERDTRPTVIMFHGNCDNIGFTLPLAQIFVHRMRCHVLMLSPRGYVDCSETISNNRDRD